MARIRPFFVIFPFWDDSIVNANFSQNSHKSYCRTIEPNKDQASTCTVLMRAHLFEQPDFDTF